MVSLKQKTGEENPMQITLKGGVTMTGGKWQKKAFVIFACLFFFVWILELDAFARVGGGGSSGSRGSRSYSAPSRSYSPSPTRPSGAQTSPSRAIGPQAAQPQQPSMWRTFAMGALGGVAGSMLFGGLGRAGGGGGGGMGGSGLGLLEILLICGAIYFIYRYFKKRKQQQSQPDALFRTGSAPSQGTPYPAISQDQDVEESDIQTGIDHIHQMDPSFNENRFTDQCMDNFFKIQGAWANRDISSVRGILTDEMFNILRGDAEKLKAEKKINKLDNIAVRTTEITEVWQEGGMDFITVRFLANLLDYTVSDTGELLSGSKTEPIKFEEYWTFTRPVGNNPWQMSAINQA